MAGSLKEFIWLERGGGGKEGSFLQRRKTEGPKDKKRMREEVS
jgi:hypothetical protein